MYNLQVREQQPLAKTSEPTNLPKEDMRENRVEQYVEEKEVKKVMVNKL